MLKYIGLYIEKYMILFKKINNRVPQIFNIILLKKIKNKTFLKLLNIDLKHF